MKLVSYNKEEQDQLAILVDDVLYDTDLLHPDLPVTMSMFLNFWEDVYSPTVEINTRLEEGKISHQQGFDYETATVLAPVPHATSFRTALAFEQPAPILANAQATESTAAAAYPAFNFGNHNAFQGAGEVSCMPDHLKKLDFELQVAIVICRAGKNIQAAEADMYIGGYMILNNLKARHFQTGGTARNSDAANGGGFGTPLGPMLVTPDELESFRVECKAGHTGNRYNLPMKCWVNRVQVCEGNTADMDWTFAEIIEQASYGVQLFPGDIISSGPVPNGCFLQLNAHNSVHAAGEQWLQAGDIVELEIEGLGKLSNTITEIESDDTLQD